MRYSFTLALLFIVLVGCCFAPAQDTPAPPCHAGAFGRALGRDSKTMLHGFASAPRNAIRPKNLAWELPVGAATGILIAKADRPTADRFQSRSLQQDSGLWSDVGIGLELGAGATSWMMGCARDRPSLANSAFTALVAGGFGQVINLGIKEAFRRQYPYQPHSTGAFFSRSRAGSFTSGHATTSFAFAAAIAHRYPHKPWVVWGSYGLATALSVARLPSKKHYPSDILVGAAIGYVTGTYIGNHATPAN